MTTRATKIPKPTSRKKKQKQSAYEAARASKLRKPVAPAEPLYFNWREPDTFADCLKLHMHRHGESSWTLWHAIVEKGDRLHAATIRFWRNGSKAPRSAESMKYLTRIEVRYNLPSGYFAARLPHRARAARHAATSLLGKTERRLLAWHLPDDFDARPLAEQAEIIAWVRRVIMSGATEYRRFHARAIKHRYGVRFPELTGGRTRSSGDEEPSVDPNAGCRDAPPGLATQMRALVEFKTATLTASGFKRRGVWGAETAAQKIEHLGLMFGALSAAPNGAVSGLGAPLANLTIAHLVFPAVWDWYVQWRETRRGFYTYWEVDMLALGCSLTSPETGWLTQNPRLSDSLSPLAHLVTQAEIDTARADWTGACASLHQHALARAKEVERVSRVHRDPFEAILPVLESESPLREYRKIAEEIARLMPDASRYPIAAAEALRSLLMIRLGLHLGLRQKNLRQLLFCPRGHAHRTERQLEDQGRGELRWSERDGKWEVFIPASAFKNAHSSFFGGQPFRLALPDIHSLYESIDQYARRARGVLLRGAADPGTFFVKSMKRTSKSAAYDQHTFYEAWRLIIQRYGIWNPYTQRGAIRGLLPHGPHNVRDVLATHILKETGSFEQASYAIQDTPDIVAKHYGRFLPENKASLAAQILNRAWTD